MFIPTEDQIAEISVSYSSLIPAERRIKVLNARSAVPLFRQVWNLGEIELRESFKVMLLNTQKQLLGIKTLSEGTTRSTFIDLRLLFGIILKSNAAAIILAHNHPSGVLQPSACDIRLTERIIQVARIFDIDVCDHVIITAEGFFSFNDQGILDDCECNLSGGLIVFFESEKDEQL